MTDSTHAAEAADPGRTLQPLHPDAPAPTEDPLRFGVGARVTAAVMSDDYVTVLTDALAELDSSGLLVETGDVSTCLGGHEHDLQRALTQLAAAIARTEKHASLTIVLSRGCPGEVGCALPQGASARTVDAPRPQTTRRCASAEWALYPLADQGVAPGAEPDHMRDIYAAIDHAKELGTFSSHEHFVTRLEGDLGAVIATAVAGWVLVGRSVQHVTSHLTISLNSPSHPRHVLPSEQTEASAGSADGDADGESAASRGEAVQR